MNIEQLLCFQALKKHENFSKAADSIFISQSCLSKQIKALEDDLGFILFHRSYSKTSLTEAGEKIANQVDNIILSYEKLQFELKSLKKMNGNKIRMASFDEMAYYGITNMIVGFEQGRSDFFVESKECDHSHMIDLLDTELVDMIIGYNELWPNRHEYVSIPLKREQIVLIVNKNHPLASHNKISLNIVAKEKFCFIREDPLLFKAFQSTCELAGFTPDLTLSNVRLPTIKQYISKEMRMTLLPRSCADNLFNESIFHLIDIEETPLLTLTLMVNKKLLTDTSRDFINFAKKYYKSEPPV